MPKGHTHGSMHGVEHKVCGWGVVVAVVPAVVVAAAVSVVVVVVCGGGVSAAAPFCAVRAAVIVCRKRRRRLVCWACNAVTSGCDVHLPSLDDDLAFHVGALC